SAQQSPRHSHTRQERSQLSLTVHSGFRAHGHQMGAIARDPGILGLELIYEALVAPLIEIRPF
ncbi:hypothetical protein, partial [Escherichia coli]|uniref:hypothetical protein n=1 Tax=Escherichia coli TaxID=562 RepID=UPI0019540AC8